MAAIAVILLIGCSGSGVDSPVFPSELKVMNSVDTSHNLWGLWEISADPEGGTLDFVKLRTASFHANVLPFLEPPAGVKLAISNLVFDGTICDVDVSLTHPFPGLSMYTGFDVSGIFISKGNTFGFNDGAIVMTGDGDTRLLNPDGYTRWWNPPEFAIPGMPILRYRDGLLGNEHADVGYNCTLNAYRLFGDDIDVEGDILDIDPTNRIPFSHGYTNTRHYTIDFADEVVFNYAVDANWEPPTGQDPYELDDFPSSANRPEAWTISVTVDENTLYNDGSGNLGGDLSLTIDVLDHFNAGLNTVWLDSPGNFDYAVLPGPIGGGDGYSTYEVDIIDATPSPGSIDILVGIISGDRCKSRFYT